MVTCAMTNFANIGTFIHQRRGNVLDFFFSFKQRTRWNRNQGQSCRAVFKAIYRILFLLLPSELFGDDPNDSRESNDSKIIWNALLGVHSNSILKLWACWSFSERILAWLICQYRRWSPRFFPLMCLSWGIHRKKNAQTRFRRGWRKGSCVSHSILFKTFMIS